MTSYNPSVQEKRELDMYMKFFTAKCVQIIVQSRLGQRICNKCKVTPSRDDWFNLTIDDNEEVLRETKRLTTSIHYLSAFSLNVEISLKTKDGDAMVLEVWTLNMDPFSRKPVKIRHTVYQRLSRLARSLVTAVRAVHGYKLSRAQSSDSYVICYKLYTGTPNTGPLSTHSHDPTSCNIGSVATPFGTVSLKGVCRSQLLFLPTDSNQSLILKEDYFKTEERGSRVPELHGDAELREMEEPSTDFEVVNCGPTGSPSFVSTDHLAHSPNSKHREHQSGLVSNTFRGRDRPRSFGAFAPRRSSVSLDEEVPFSIYVELANDYDVDIQFPLHSPPDSPTATVSGSILDDPDFETHKEEDFVYVGVKTPFAPPHSDSDIGRFQKIIQKAPSLSKLGKTVCQTIEELDFEELTTTAREFDDFVTLLEKLKPNTSLHGHSLEGSPL
ncbi:autophagy-related protein 13-like [Watersipora subatra]|uniref:autophagy-related protein 13-like n=1 Tax=Watersipora subatra TaxID=2589382 RepID=UPI00355ACE9D